MQNDRQKTVFQRKNKKGVLLYAILVNQPGLEPRDPNIKSVVLYQLSY